MIRMALTGHRPQRLGFNKHLESAEWRPIIDWLEETGRSYPIRIHSMNSVGVENMRCIIHRNGWTEIKGV
jgi:hypothetical protein